MKELNELVAIAERADAYGNLMNANPHKILSIAEAFRALEQRAGAADAKLTEMEKQQAVGVARMEMAIGKEGLRHYQCFVDMRPDLVVAELNTGMELFTRPAPAVSLAELVPQRKPITLDAPISAEWAARTSGYRSGFNDCVDEILRNIEEANK